VSAVALTVVADESAVASYASDLVEAALRERRASVLALPTGRTPIPLYADLGYRRGMCPVAEEYYEQEISLPLFPGLADGDVDRVIDLVRGFVGG
jgi:dTDP-4-amino-4,6-dideoxygalactose transaminase